MSIFFEKMTENTIMSLTITSSTSKDQGTWGPGDLAARTGGLENHEFLIHLGHTLPSMAPLYHQYSSTKTQKSCTNRIAVRNPQLVTWGSPQQIWSCHKSWNSEKPVLKFINLTLEYLYLMHKQHDKTSPMHPLYLLHKRSSRTGGLDFQPQGTCFEDRGTFLVDRGTY